MLAIFALSVVSYAASGGGKHHKEAKENKKFATVTFIYTGPQPATTSDLEDPDNWTTGDPTVLCPSGTNVLCGISFDTGTYPLGGTKPSVTFLTNQVAVHYLDSPGSHTFTVNGVTYYRKTS